MVQLPVDTNEIVITAARAPDAAADSAASVTIIDGQRIERLGEPLVPLLLRLTPSAAVAGSGGNGAFTEVRIRGAEANHTLLFIDGIRANDPASGNVPRFELLNADIASRIEVVRGPQSALWGSEAIGGVIAVGGVADGKGVATQLEAGSANSRRASASGSVAAQDFSLSGAAGWQSSSGIDIFGGGDRDGYRNLSGRVRMHWTPTPLLTLDASAFSLTGRSEFDGNDPVTFARTHDLESRSGLAAARIAASLGADQGSWRGSVSASLLGSSNRNAFAGDPINRTSGARGTIGAQIEHRLSTGPVRHLIIAAADAERERFKALDTVYGGATAQDRSRAHRSLTLEWRAETGPLISDIAIRRDLFNRFKDATTLRASLLAKVRGGFALAASYGEGLAQPTFFDLYGFFPGSFLGNPGLKPESSRGVEASLRYAQDRLSAALTWHRQKLSDEIVDVSVPGTFLFTTVNRDTGSRRSGVEAELGWSPSPRLRLSAHYALLRATEDNAAGLGVREVRRPRHSGSVAADGSAGPLTYGASLAFTGARRDINFDLFPSVPVRLGSYWLAGARIAYAVRPGVELFARAANAFDERYQDAFGYRTEGRSVHGGIRLAARR